LRSMVIKIDPKLVDTMLALARDEHAFALQTVQQEPADNGLGGGDDRRDHRRRHAEKS
jgi:hypothetical protein